MDLYPRAANCTHKSTRQVKSVSFVRIIIIINFLMFPLSSRFNIFWHIECIFLYVLKTFPHFRFILQTTFLFSRTHTCTAKYGRGRGGGGGGCGGAENRSSNSCQCSNLVSNCESVVTIIFPARDVTLLVDHIGLKGLLFPSSLMSTSVDIHYCGRFRKIHTDPLIFKIILQT